MKYTKIIQYKELYSQRNHYTLVANELYTLKELQKLKRAYKINNDDYTIIDVPKNKTGFIFGARFELIKSSI